MQGLASSGLPALERSLATFPEAPRVQPVPAHAKPEPLHSQSDTGQQEREPVWALRWSGTFRYKYRIRRCEKPVAITRLRVSGPRDCMQRVIDGASSHGRRDEAKGPLPHDGGLRELKELYRLRPGR